MTADLRRQRPGPGRPLTGSMRARSPGHWQLRVYVGPDEHGRPKQAFRTFRGDEDEARSALQSLVAEISSRGRPETDRERTERMEKELAVLRCQVPARPKLERDATASPVVYLLYFPDVNLVKIGTTRQLSVRLATHDCERGRFVIIGLARGGSALEASFLGRFAAYRHSMTSREWFVAAPEILEFASSCRYMPHPSHGAMWLSALAGDGW